MEFIGDIARKTGEPSLLAVEAVKTEKACQIAQDNGLFYVPRVINFDEENGVLDFERLEGLVTLQQLIIDRDPRSYELSQKAGRALAAIHEKLVLPEEMKYELPPEWMDSGNDNVFIHGDFACINVCFHKPSGKLVILDWSTAPILGRIPTFGSRYFDILWFVSCIFRGAPNKRVLSWNAGEMADAFLRSYARNVSPENLSNLRDYLSKARRLQIKNVWYLAHRQRSAIRTAAYLLCQLLMYVRLLIFFYCFMSDKCTIEN